MSNLAEVLHRTCGLSLSQIGIMSKLSPDNSTVRKWVWDPELDHHITSRLHQQAMVWWGIMEADKNPDAKVLWEAIWPEEQKPHIYQLLIYVIDWNVKEVSAMTGIKVKRINKILRQPAIRTTYLRKIAPFATDLYSSKYSAGDKHMAFILYRAIRDTNRLSDYRC